MIRFQCLNPEVHTTRNQNQIVDRFSQSSALKRQAPLFHRIVPPAREPRALTPDLHDASRAAVAHVAVILPFLPRTIGGGGFFASVVALRLVLSRGLVPVLWLGGRQIWVWGWVWVRFGWGLRCCCRCCCRCRCASCCYRTMSRPRGDEGRDGVYHAVVG